MLRSNLLKKISQQTLQKGRNTILQPLRGHSFANVEKLETITKKIADSALKSMGILENRV
jgi:hypothetical protein